MADADLGTRAPENDAAEDAASSTAKPAPTSASKSTPIGTTGLSDQCVCDRPTPAGRQPAGEIRTLGDVDVYISKPTTYPQTPARLLLLLTGGTGVRSANNQIQADLYADAGYVVVMPDLFEGDVAPNEQAGEDDGDGNGGPAATTTPAESFLDLFKTKAAETVKSFLIDMWLARHTEAKVLPILQRVLAAARDEFADAAAAGGGVYAVGYCFGGRYVLLLAGDRADRADGVAPARDGDVEAGGKTAAPGPLIKAGALAHATLVSPDDFHGLQAPLSLVCVENDPMFPDDVRVAGEDYLSDHNIEHEVQVYPGVPHGFAVVGDYADKTIKTAQATAFDQMLQWLQAH